MLFAVSSDNKHEAAFRDSWIFSLLNVLSPLICWVRVLSWDTIFLLSLLCHRISHWWSSFQPWWRHRRLLAKEWRHVYTIMLIQINMFSRTRLNLNVKSPKVIWLVRFITTFDDSKLFFDELPWFSHFTSSLWSAVMLEAFSLMIIFGVNTFPTGFGIFKFAW